jgi:hypothetical protein
MKVKARSLLVVGAMLLVLLSPAASAAIVQGHSPIVLLVVDPNGHEYGCLGTAPLTCTSTASPDFINQIPSENPSYTFPTDPVCSTTDCPIVNIQNPVPGKWTVYYFSTLTEGTASTYITVQDCSNGNPGSSCVTIDVVGSQENPVPLTVGTSGSNSFGLPLTTVSAPEFPLGFLLVIGLLAPALMILGKVQRDRRAKQ